MSTAREDRRHLSAITLLTLLAVLVVFGLIGWNQLSAPGPWDSDAAASEDCIPGLAKGDLVRTTDVTISVYNAGSRSGLASQTQEQLTSRGFIAGDIGNAPEDLEKVKKATVLAPSKDDPAASLVARQFGAKLKPTKHEDIGAGVEVVVGDKFTGLVKAPRRIRAKVSGSGC